MTDSYFLLFDISLSSLLVIFCVDALARGRSFFYLLVAGVIYGLFLEWATIEQLQTYHYSDRFSLKLGEVPLSIGMAWGLVVYSVCLFSDTTSLPAWSRPALDGLLALNIDMGLDIIAIRLDMWSWGIGLNEEFLGVRYGNFWAWFWVVVSFSLTFRLLRALPIAENRKWLPPFGAIVGGIIGVVISNHYIQSVFDTHYELAVALTIIIALLIVCLCRPRFFVRRANPLIYIILIGSHFYFLTVGLASGAIFNPPMVFVIWVGSATVTLVIHRPLLRNILNLLPYFRDSRGAKSRRYHEIR